MHTYLHPCDSRRLRLLPFLGVPLRPPFSLRSLSSSIERSEDGGRGGAPRKEHVHWKQDGLTVCGQPSKSSCTSFPRSGALHPCADPWRCGASRCHSPGPTRRLPTWPRARGIWAGRSPVQRRRQRWPGRRRRFDLAPSTRLCRVRGCDSRVDNPRCRLLARALGAEGPTLARRLPTEA